MSGDGKKPRRSYRAPQREAAAVRTRTAIVEASKHLFEDRGWAATTVRSIAGAAGVSPKTVEALFGTKAALLRAAVDYAIRGDVDPVPMPQREIVVRMEAAPDAPSMLELHAFHVRRVNEESAGIARAVEQAAAHDPSVAELWRQMNRNRAFGVRWATETLRTKPGRRRGLRRRQVEAAFWVALDWGTFRTLTEHAGLTPGDFEAWLRHYYASMLVAP
jgi:TetR/AcrR family transcriptional regulator, regulator of autoinduction and epiphytic fitness